MFRMTIGQIGFAVQDMDRAVEFYRDKVGLRILFGSPNMAFFDCGGVRLALGPAEADRGPLSSIVYFKVMDLEAAAAGLKSRGVAFDRDAHLVARFPEHDLWMAFFHDPDGNTLALMCENRH
jgi:catechol 2,3-dioxygenase-like lactoylglutathione lyase family enzyme